VELFEQIRREYEHGVGTIKGVARKFGVHRRMVREAIGNAVPAPRKIPERDQPKLAPAVAFIEGMLEADRKAPRKQRHTAHRIWCRLKAEHPGIDIAESTVRRYVRLRKQELGLAQAEVFVPQSYRWGQEGQVDWYEAWAEIDGEPQKVYLFCMRSMGSGGAFHRAYPHASQQAFLEAHELAFAYFGGVFESLRYDNLSSAVKRILRGSRREETERFIAFRSHWGFASEFCTPGEGHEKGGVEGENGYFRRNHLVPLPKVGSWEELNRFLLGESKRDEQRVIGDRSHTVGVGMCLEREHLSPLAEKGFQLAAISFPTVNSSLCARVLTNFYSVPAPVGCEVQARVYAAEIEFWHEGKCIARHDRCFSRRGRSSIWSIISMC
jgi:transposase